MEIKDATIQKKWIEGDVAIGGWEQIPCAGLAQGNSLYFTFLEHSEFQLIPCEAFFLPVSSITESLHAGNQSENGSC